MCFKTSEGQEGRGSQMKNPETQRSQSYFDVHVVVQFVPVG